MPRATPHKLSKIPHRKRAQRREPNQPRADVTSSPAPVLSITPGTGDLHLLNPRWSRSPKLRAAVVATLLIAGLLHRLIGIGVQPPQHATEDEIHYSWAGLSILHGHQPTSWSLLSGYRGHTLGYGAVGNGRAYIVRPALDHPPLFSLLAGAFVSLTRPAPLHIKLYPSGDVELWEINLASARILPVLLYAISFFLLLDLASLSIGFWPACAALAFYSFARHMVLHQRLLISDNFVTTLVLANLVVLQRYLLGRCTQRAFAIATLVLVPCAIMSKIVSVCAAAALGAVLLAQRKWKQLWIPASAAILGLVAVLIYAAALDWQLFVSVQQSQAQRFSGFNTLERLVGLMQLVGHAEFSQLICFAWIFAFAMAIDRSAPSISLALVAYFLAFTYFADARRVFGWHQLPFYPLLCLALGWYTRKAWKASSPALVIAFVGSLLTWVWQAAYLLAPNYPTWERAGYLIMIALLLAATQLTNHIYRITAIRTILIASMTLGLLLETIYARRFNPAQWTEVRPAVPGAEKIAPPFMK